MVPTPSQTEAPTLQVNLSTPNALCITLVALKPRIKACNPFICGGYINTKIFKALNKLYMFTSICEHRVLMRFNSLQLRGLKLMLNRIGCK